MATFFPDPNSNHALLEGEARHPAYTLRGRAWLDHAVQVAGTDANEFAERYIYRGRTRSKLVDKWLAGVASPTRQSALAVERLLPGTLQVFDSPVFPLLGPRVSRRQLVTLLEPWQAPAEAPYAWRFPNDADLTRRERVVHVLIRDDTQRLRSRGDLYGFIVIVGLVREAVFEGDFDMYVMRAKDMYRAVPGVLRLPWFAKHAELLRLCLRALPTPGLYARLMFDVDWPLILRQAVDPEYETVRELCPRDPTTHRFILPADPILPATIIVGREVRAQEEVRAERAARRRARRERQAAG